jgi:hypothetical protein
MSRPRRKALALPTAATSAVAVNCPDPGDRHQASHRRFWAMQYPKSSSCGHKAELSHQFVGVEFPRIGHPAFVLPHRGNYAAWSRANTTEQNETRWPRSRARRIAYSERRSADYARIAPRIFHWGRRSWGHPVRGDCCAKCAGAMPCPPGSQALFEGDAVTVRDRIMRSPKSALGPQFAFATIAGSGATETATASSALKSGRTRSALRISRPLNCRPFISLPSVPRFCRAATLSCGKPPV